MYKYLLLIPLLCFQAIVSGQQLEEDPHGRSYSSGEERTGLHQRTGGGSLTTIEDTLELSLLRRTSVRGIFLNTASSATSMSQFYMAPEPVVVRGFDFYAYQSDPASTVPVPITCYIYRAANKLPTGQPLAQVTVSVPKSSNTTLPAIRKSAVFPSPVLISGGFVLVVETASAISVSVSSNNWETTDGDGDYYGGAKIGTTWYPGSNITVNNLPFDADFFLNPYVDYDLQTGFEMSERCLFGEDSIHFMTTHSHFVHSKFFNRAVFMGKSGVELFNWNFNMGAGVQNFKDTSLVFVVPQKYKIDLQTEYSTWRRVINPLFSDSIDIPPVAQFSYSQNNNELTFTNQSTGTDMSYWSFGDSTFSILRNPVYNYYRWGTFSVTLIITNGCGSDTSTQQIMVQSTGLGPDAWPSDLNVYPVPAQHTLHIDWPGKAISRVQLLSLQGQVIADVVPSGSRHSIPIEHLPSGPYLLRVLDNTQMYHRVVMKQ